MTWKPWTEARTVLRLSLIVAFYCLSPSVLCSLQTFYPLGLHCLFVFCLFTFRVVIRYHSDLVKNNINNRDNCQHTVGRPRPVLNMKAITSHSSSCWLRTQSLGNCLFLSSVHLNLTLSPGAYSWRLRRQAEKQNCVVVFTEAGVPYERL
jgi:hypothetical protein